MSGGRLHGEWWQSPEGLWVPRMAGGAGGTYIAGGYEHPRSLLFRHGFAPAQQTLALSSNYVNATSGSAIASRFAYREADTLSKIYFFVTGYTGTAANVNDINCEFRNNSDTTGPSSTLHDSVTVDPASATGWISATWVTGFTLVANTSYWAIVGDADGGATDFATVLRSLTGFTLTADQLLYQAVQTTDGWASVRTFAGVPSNIVLLFTSGRTVGNPFPTGNVASTSSTNQRGLRFIAPAGCKVFGMSFATGAAGCSGINLWSGSNGPGGSADANGTTPISQATLASATEVGFAFETPPTLTQGTIYRLVMTYAAVATQPARFQIGTGADATLRSAMLGGNAWYWAEADGTTDWSNDNTSEFPAVDVIVEDFVTASAGGGGGRARLIPNV